MTSHKSAQTRAGLRGAITSLSVRFFKYQVSWKSSKLLEACAH